MNTGKVRVIADSEGFVGLDSGCRAKVVTMGNIIEVTAMQGVSGGGPCRKLDKHRYVDLRDGEIKKYNHYESRADGIQSIKQTMARIRSIVNSNVVDPEKVRWITLTYRENMTDTNRLRNDYERFWKRFLYWCQQNGYDKPEYITVQEPQGRGAWHVHAFFIWPIKAPYLDNNVLFNLWGHGYVKVKALHDCDNVGAYFSAYLANIPLDDMENLSQLERDDVLSIENTLVAKEVDGKIKKFVKGARLSMYPPGMNILRCTRGLKQPEIEHMTLEEAKKKVSEATETFSKNYKVFEDCLGEEKVVNIVSKSYYNRVRASRKE